MARTKSPNYEIQQQNILEKAAQLFAKQSFPSASIAQLAGLCRMSKPLLYHYYRDKSHLLFDIADTYVDRLIAIVEQVAAEQLDSSAHLQRLITLFMEEYASSRHYHIVLVQDVKFLADDDKEIIVGKQNQVVNAFADLIARLRPELPTAQIKPIAMTLFGMMNWTFTWFRADGPLDRSSMAQIVSQLFLHGLYSPGLEMLHESVPLPQNRPARAHLSD